MQNYAPSVTKPLHDSGERLCDFGQGTPSPGSEIVCFGNNKPDSDKKPNNAAHPVATTVGLSVVVAIR